MASLHYEFQGYTLDISNDAPQTGDTVTITACSPKPIFGKQAYVEMQKALVPAPKDLQRHYFDEGTCFSFDFLVQDTIKTKYVITVANYTKTGLIQIGYWVNGTNAATPPPQPQPIDTGPQIIECIFPTLSLNFIAVMSGLASWIGCILHNIITLIQWIVDWVLHFPDHLDAWISRLFGVDPALPFFDEVMKKIDVWISGKFGVDPEKPFLDEILSKIFTMLTGWIGALVDEDEKNIGRIK